MTDSIQNKDANRVIRIGCASGFWGDTNTAAFQLVNQAQIDYLVFDYLSEVTMSIMARAKMKDPTLGYAVDFVKSVMAPLLKKIADKKIKVVSNAGGINPLACRDALVKLIEEAGLNLKVAVVMGDDLISEQDALRAAGVTEMFSGQKMPENMTSINAYLGSVAIRDALAAGADIVVTGRVVDSAVVIGPLMHEFGWSTTDYNHLAQAALAGHVIECGAQCTGGNFTDWEDVPGYDNMGFPIAEVSSDGSFVISKPEGTGGLISTATIGEQIVYEINDPQSYILPDVVADFSHVHLEQVSDNLVKVSGAKGRAPTSQYKVSATYADGYRLLVSFVIAGIDARRKAEKVSTAILTKVERGLASRGVSGFTEKSVEFIGSESTYGPHGRRADTREVVVKIAVSHPIQQACGFLAMEIAQASTGMAPGLAGIMGGRPKVSPVVKLFSFLLDKNHCKVEIDLNGERRAIEIPAGDASPMLTPIASGEVANLSSSNDLVTVPLIKVAHARSGDKGNASNIGVLARQAEYLPWIRASLTTEAIAAYMAHVMDGANSKVYRFELPGLNAMNIFITNALGGGGMASLRIDPQGKALAQQLLEMPVQVPASLLK